MSDNRLLAGTYRRPGTCYECPFTLPSTFNCIAICESDRMAGNEANAQSIEKADFVPRTDKPLYSCSSHELLASAIWLFEAQNKELLQICYINLLAMRIGL